MAMTIERAMLTTQQRRKYDDLVALIEEAYNAGWRNCVQARNRAPYRPITGTDATAMRDDAVQGLVRRFTK